MNRIKRPHLLMLSHVLPFPGLAGQQQRVYYMLKALRKLFHVTFLTSVDITDMEKAQEQLSVYCDEAVLLTSRYSSSKARRVLCNFKGLFYILGSGLKLSNYVIGRLEFSPERITAVIEPTDFDCVLFEYWHATNSVSVFHNKGIPCVLDMHNILWRSFAQQLNVNPVLPGWWKRRAVTRYRRREEKAWKQFDGIIAINAEEYKYVQSKIPGDIRLFYTPMGADLDLWSYSWQPSHPPRVAYYGGLGSRHNQREALRSYQQIMPGIWREFPKAELWLVGSNPPEFLRALSADSRVKVPGYVKNIQPLLATMSVVVCPWSGRYGFRSRLVEVMALGVPVVASPDAVYGMEIDGEKGVLLGATDNELIEYCLRLMREPAFAQQQSILARRKAEEKFSFEMTYGRFTRQLYEFVISFNRKFQAGKTGKE